MKKATAATMSNPASSMSIQCRTLQRHQRRSLKHF